jgi:hypothetical protein
MEIYFVYKKRLQDAGRSIPKPGCQIRSETLHREASRLVKYVDFFEGLVLLLVSLLGNSLGI